jgi:glycosyltransferase involved in cell wall biosynthesis
MSPAASAWRRLTAAFRVSARWLSALSGRKPRTLYPREPLPDDGDLRPLPLIIISYNRAAMLRRVIASCRRQTIAVEIVVHDNGSVEPETLALLDELEREGIRVFRNAPISNADELNRVDETVSAVFASREPGPYIVTDCDVELASSSTETIATYLRLLNAFPDAECVGPMLRIDDIRKSYPLFGRVMNLHIRQFWRRRPRIVRIGELEIAYIRAKFDTTFAVHRSTHAFRRMKAGIRVYSPFDARHLDWYPHEFAADDSTAAQAYRRSAISHWGNHAYRNEFSSERPRYASYRVITRLPSGRLRLERRRVADNPD